MKTFAIYIVSFLLMQNIFAQNFITKEKTLNTIFNNLINGYASNKTPPQLKLLAKKLTNLPAEYKASPAPIILIDVKLFDMCISLGKDSANALSIVLAHELAHYYKDHTWCSDYAFVISKSNSTFAQKLNTVSKQSKIEKESIADADGIFYACVAGYTPFEIYDELLEKIYHSYGLPANLIGYPTKQQRKAIAREAERKARELYSYFKAGIKALEQNKLDDAINAFEKTNSYISFRENYNNLGVARTRKALLLKTKSYEEVNFPDRFLYPLEIENKSRLSKDDTRSLDDEKAKEFNSLLKQAQKDFQEAIRIDPSFSKSYINLACVYDLMDNWEGAIGKIKELTNDQQNTIDAKRILAIAYYHNNLEDKAENIWYNIENRR